jgi:hypothetical protein
MGTWVFIRGNAPFEFSLGNYHGSNGMGWFGKHPTQNEWEYAKYKRMGELAYVADHKRVANNFVKQYPREFAALCASRALGFWTGTWLTYVDPRLEPWQPWSYWMLSLLMLGGLIAASARQVDGAGLYFWLMFTYPSTYALVFISPRYRHAIEPEMLLLTTYFVYLALQHLAKRFRAKETSRVELQPALIDVD